MSLLYGLSENKLQSCQRAEAYPTGVKLKGPMEKILWLKTDTKRMLLFPVMSFAPTVESIEKVVVRLLRCSLGASCHGTLYQF
jgi:hypothetical protein